MRRGCQVHQQMVPDQAGGCTAGRRLLPSLGKLKGLMADLMINVCSQVFSTWIHIGLFWKDAGQQDQDEISCFIQHLPQQLMPKVLHKVKPYRTELRCNAKITLGNLKSTKITGGIE